MSSHDTKNDRNLVPLLTRATVLILSAVLFWLYFVGDVAAPTAKLAFVGGVVGVISYTGLLFTKMESTSPANS
jgi:hypothetical protein